MLFLPIRRFDWVNVTHAASGDVLKIRIERFKADGSAVLGFLDDPHNFGVEARYGHKRYPAADPSAKAERGRA